MNLTAPNTTERRVILCDDTGTPGGAAEIIAAHTGDGQLHLAFSVYVFSPDRQRLLIQRRSPHKMLWPLVWANTCCSHPGVGEAYEAAARRRLMEEMGFDCPLKKGPAFVYRALDPSGRGVEHEYDACFVGTYDGDPIPNPAEVADWRWMDLDDLQQDMRDRPTAYAPWLHLGLPKVMAASL